MRLKKKGIIVIIAIILVLAILAVSAFFLFRKEDVETSKPKKNDETISDMSDEYDDSDNDSDDEDSDEDSDEDDYEDDYDDYYDDEYSDDYDDYYDDEDYDDSEDYDDNIDDEDNDDSDVPEDTVTDVEREIIKTQELKGKVYFTNYKTAKTLYYIDASTFDLATLDMMMSLQGIVAKKESQIFLYYPSEKIIFETLKDTYGINMVKVDDPWILVDKFKGYLNNNGYVRYIVYEEGETYFEEPFAPDSVNVAATIAGQENYLMIDESLVAKAKAHGLVERENALNYDGYMIFEKYKDKVNQRVFASTAKYDHALYDVTISLGCMAYRGEEMEWMLSQLEPDGYVIGWYNNEGAGVKIASMNGYATLPLDHARNFTVYAGLEHEKVEQKNSIKYATENKKDVHYVTFIMSDGDNLNYDLAMMTSNSYMGTKSLGEIPFGWSYSPATYEWLPIATKYLYSNKMTYNDNFLAAVNGYGYMHPDIYPQNKIEDFAKRTAEYMKMTDMKYITLASFVDDTSKLDSFIPSFSQYDQILGGHFNDMSSYGQCYVHSEYGGGVVWYNDKPFIYDREALALDWQITKDRSLTIETAISEMAYRINNIYERNINSIEGYTIINVHPWSVKYEDCVTLVEQFNDDVVVVTPSEFFELVTKNVPHEDYLDMFGKNLCGIFDYTDAEVDSENHFINIDTFKRLKVTTDLSFDFTENKGTGSWKLKSGTTENDNIYYNGSDVYMAARKLSADNNADNQIYNKVKLPANAKKFTYSIKGNASTRLLAVTESGEVINLSYWEQLESASEFKDVTVDISQVAGKTVTLLLQMQDDRGAAVSCNIRNIKIS